ncbi:MAG: YhdH/YhfP family quinone oxidoreductase [Gammaproteobacteria bacterium]|nr:acryloyl-CoA reductase [Sideroxydans sp.]MBU3903794.1 YhdH/YhfP family quinone oxidoreductase [Gammaproteobacteria bacterium]MBU4045427.1 YhdH/YhfP family quinone oxidoreductase [Gammaproteobacteria bacterium]MBU4150736.1 YhdH/YhfP family quinone oxidoreductase [Gammaproteobacteria bacterium]
MTTFRAFRIFEEDGKSQGRLVDLSLDDLDAGELVIRVHHSGVNYKDALAATGAGKVIRRFPCVGGVDLSGVVESSADTRFKAGDAVLVTGYDMGVAHDGGFAEYARVPADWVVPLPVGLTLFEAMALGTAGFTAALAIHRLEQNEVTPDKGKVIVTGATGGVGSLAVQMLAQLGYHVVALTGKESEQDFLKSLGASEVLLRSSVDIQSTRPLEKGLWAAALDAVGGDTLAWLTRTMQMEGAIASFGNAGGAALNTTVFPFILRGVKLLGVDSAATVMPLRKQLWGRLASDLRPSGLEKIAHTITLNELPHACEQLIAGKARGRAVVDCAAN